MACLTGHCEAERLNTDVRRLTTKCGNQSVTIAEQRQEIERLKRLAEMHHQNVQRMDRLNSKAAQRVQFLTESVNRLEKQNQWNQSELARDVGLLSKLRADNARLERANRHRDDYDLGCQECGKAHILDTSLPSEIWNQIAEPNEVLCTLCIDERLAAKGLQCEAEFYYVGKALSCKLYNADPQNSESER